MSKTSWRPTLLSLPRMHNSPFRCFQITESGRWGKVVAVWLQCCELRSRHRRMRSPTLSLTNFSSSLAKLLIIFLVLNLTQNNAYSFKTAKWLFSLEQQSTVMKQGVRMSCTTKSHTQKIQWASSYSEVYRLKQCISNHFPSWELSISQLVPSLLFSW